MSETRTAADDRLLEARSDYARACQAAIRKEPWAEEDMKMALEEIRWALADIEALDEQERQQ